MQQATTPLFDASKKNAKIAGHWSNLLVFFLPALVFPRKQQSNAEWSGIAKPNGDSVQRTACFIKTAARAGTITNGGAVTLHLILCPTNMCWKLPIPYKKIPACISVAT